MTSPSENEPGPASPEPARNMLAHPDRVGHSGESRSYRSHARQEARIRHVQIVKLVGLAVDIEHGCRWISAETAGPGLIGDTRIGPVHGRRGLPADKVETRTAQHRLELVQETRGLAAIGGDVGQMRVVPAV